MNEFVKLLKDTLAVSSRLPKFGADSWIKVEAELGIEFPLSYKELLLEIGWGQWGRFLTMQSPETIINSRVFAEIAGYYIDDFPGCSFFPDVPGLFAWGDTGTRVTLFWEVSYSAEDWPIVILEHGFEPEIWRMSVPEFLWKHYIGEIQSILFPANLRDQPRVGEVPMGTYRNQ